MNKFSELLGNVNNLLAGNTDVPVSVSVEKETLYPILVAVVLVVIGGRVLIKNL